MKDLLEHVRVTLQSKHLRKYVTIFFVHRVVFQAFYTTIFGWLGNFLLLRTGTIGAPIVAHVFCNYMGFPPLSFDHKFKIGATCSHSVSFSISNHCTLNRDMDCLRAWNSWLLRLGVAVNGSCVAPLDILRCVTFCGELQQHVTLLTAIDLVCKIDSFYFFQHATAYNIINTIRSNN